MSFALRIPSSPRPWPPRLDAEDALPVRGKLTAYELRLHLFAARDLPATDDNGVVDAYVAVKINGASVESTVQHDTTHPQWYETVTMRTWLPDLEIAPQLVCAVWDRDVRRTDIESMAPSYNPPYAACARGPHAVVPRCGPALRPHALLARTSRALARRG